ncbi:RNA recognition motif domain-containing protein [Dyadobacter arcticus]|uniref:RNA recognition motif-containing protein n=1 Tax=Dyadobacter arcticus TaxID=1078754 RepID=A0ABX0UN47_9BACT|nr:RNA-binding protein [Dyadobacter arcticus]NIJ53549.1 RNA recognition motif-containing protein [Dyadobacter arcticus]
MDIFVGSLSFKLKESELREAFEKYGIVSSAKIIIDKITRQSKGFGFIEMPNDDEAKLAISSLNGADMYGRALVVNESQKREPRTDGGGGAPRGDSSREGFSRPRPTEGGDTRSSSPGTGGSSGGDTRSPGGGGGETRGPGGAGGGFGGGGFGNDKPKGGGDRKFSGGNDRGGRGGYADKSRSDNNRFGKAGGQDHKKGGGGSKKIWGRGDDDGGY